jgi:hypothetical protein
VWLSTVAFTPDKELPKVRPKNDRQLAYKLERGTLKLERGTLGPWALEIRLQKLADGVKW